MINDKIEMNVAHKKFYVTFVRKGLLPTHISIKIAVIVHRRQNQKTDKVELRKKKFTESDCEDPMAH